MLKTILTGALVASLLLALQLAASADSGHQDRAKNTSEGEHSDAHGGHGVSTLQSAGLPGAWTALMEARDAIASDVESGALGDVHAKAELLPALAATLLEQSGELDAAKRTRVEGAVNQLARAAAALHVAADRGDAPRTQKALSTLDQLLDLIRAQYPDGVLEGH